MAPPEDTPASSLPLASPSDSPIKNLLLVIAMQAEALPLVNKFQLTEDQNPPFPKGMPWIRYHGVYKDLQISIVIPGKDPIFGIDSVGTVTSALVTYASVQALKPDVIINAGTAGGFKDKGACVGDVFLATDVAFHDRRIPIPVFDLYGKRSRPTFQPTNLVNDLGLKVGRLSTGDSLDLSPQDEEIIRANDTAIKDMEGAAVSYVAELFSIPAIFLKAVTDVVDGERPTAEEFLSNLNTVSQAMEEIVTKVIEYINGKTLSSL
eukprot:TRINITY_DN20768_c0_g1_i2.p1 TRINITY_DN20768_c0_g1~~TRINITY_DN20768_c0_g1_i2.p1  ORF type:complete len:264 (+),score=53.95 TRINITY_DN20768_c0_g1_i2:171-962(+)